MFGAPSLWGSAISHITYREVQRKKELEGRCIKAGLSTWSWAPLAFMVFCRTKRVIWSFSFTFRGEMICKSIGMRHICTGTLRGMQLLRVFPKGSAAGALLPLTGKTREWATFWKINSRETLCWVGLNWLSVMSSWNWCKARRNLLLVFQEWAQACLGLWEDRLLQQPAQPTALCACSVQVFSQRALWRNFNEAWICEGRLP